MENSDFKKIYDAGILDVDDFVVDTLAFEAVMGSHAYGVATEESDYDIVGFCVPPKNLVFPHLDGQIKGFGRQKQGFRQFNRDHIDLFCHEWDVTIYSIVRFFELSMDCNPNMVEVLFAPDRCVKYINRVGNLVRLNRHLFLHKGAFYRLQGFAKSMLNKMRKKDREHERLLKYGYHMVRLIDQCRQILETGDLILDNNVEKLTAVREGEWTLDEIEEYFERSEVELRELYETSNAVRYKPDEDALKGLLLHALEEHYGTLEGCIHFDQYTIPH